MADAGTLATTAQVLLAIGAGASATQVLEANTNYWILMAESEMSLEAETDLVTNYASIDAKYKQALAAIASARAAMHAINQNPNSWQLATAQSKLNVLDSIWQSGLKMLRDKNKIDTLGL
jgi:hypothetical protein